MGEALALCSIVRPRGGVAWMAVGAGTAHAGFRAPNGSRDGSAQRRALSRAKAYERALVHSARVRFLKRAIPLGSILSVVGLVGFTLLKPFAALIPEGVSVASVDLSGSKIMMELPRLQGFKKDAKPYEVKAASAGQDVRAPHLIELRQLDAKLGLDGDGWARLESPTGHFDTQKEVLELKGAVIITTGDGLTARLRSARVEFKSGDMRSEEPVRVESKEGTIDADRLDITGNGKVITFTGHVRSQFSGEPAVGPAPGAAPAASAQAELRQ